MPPCLNCVSKKSRTFEWLKRILDAQAGVISEHWLA
jgi:hypothetical protein